MKIKTKYSIDDIVWYITINRGLVTDATIEQVIIAKEGTLYKCYFEQFEQSIVVSENGLYGSRLDAVTALNEIPTTSIRIDYNSTTGD